MAIKVPKPTAESIKKYITSLYESGLLYHFDDLLDDIVWTTEPSPEQLAVMQEAEAVIDLFRSDEANADVFDLYPDELIDF